MEATTIALNLLTEMIHHRAERRKNPGVCAASIKDCSLFRILSRRITDRGKIKGGTSGQDGVQSGSQSSFVAQACLRRAEWRAFSALIVVSAKFGNAFAEHLVGAARIVALGALQEVHYQENYRLEMRDEMTSEFDNIGQGFTCSNCAILECIEFTSGALRDANIACAGTNNQGLRHELRRLDACLVALSPAFLDFVDDDDRRGTCQACAAQFISQLLRALKTGPDTTRFKNILCETGVPLSLLSTVTLEKNLGVDSSSDREQKHMRALECYMTLCGFDFPTIDEFCSQNEHVHADAQSRTLGCLSRYSGNSKDWLFAFRWFAREARAVHLTSRSGASHNKSLSSLARLASDILAELPNERIPRSWPRACRQCAALILVHTCALESMIPQIPESSSACIAALEGLRRPSEFSALLNDGLLDNLTGVAGLLNLIATIYDQAHSHLELQPGLIDFLAKYFENAGPDTAVNACLSGHQVKTTLKVLAIFPASAITSRAMCACVERTFHRDLTNLMHSNPRIVYPLICALSPDEPIETEWIARLSHAFGLACRSLSDAIAMEQGKPLPSHGLDDESIIEKLLPIVLKMLRTNNFERLECVEVARALAMVTQRESTSRHVNMDTARKSVLLLEHVWGRWNSNISNNTDTRDVGADEVEMLSEVLLWCLNATNVSLGYALRQRVHDSETAEVQSLVIEALSQQLKSICLASETECHRASRSAGRNIVFLMQIQLVAKALSVHTQSETKADFVMTFETASCDTFCRPSTREAVNKEKSVAVLIDITLRALMETNAQSTCTNLSAIEIQNAQRGVACWTLAALLDVPAVESLLCSPDSASSPRVHKLRNTMMLRMQEVITSSLGSRSYIACEGACATLHRLITIGNRSTRAQDSTVAIWHQFTATWLLSHGWLVVSRYAALYVRTSGSRVYV